MKTELITLKQTLFYLKTRSPIKSKLEVIKWFLIRLPLRLLLKFKEMKMKIRNIEKKDIISIMGDGAIFIHAIEELNNLYEIYGEKKQEKFKFEEEPLSYVIDIGAHIGIYTIKKALQNQETRFYSIEPEINNFKKLIENIKLNNLENITPLRLAISDKEGYFNLYIDEFGSGQHSLLKRSKRYEKIKVTTLDKLVKKLNLKSIDLIKIDTEGAEYSILVGGMKTLKKFRPKLIIETHPWIDKDCNKKILKLLNSINYNLKIFRNRNEAIIIYAW